MMDAEALSVRRSIRDGAFDLIALVWALPLPAGCSFPCHSQATMETAGPDAPLGSSFSLKEFLKRRTEAKACE
jgi:hypothetical protein